MVDILFQYFFSKLKIYLQGRFQEQSYQPIGMFANKAIYF